MTRAASASMTWSERRMNPREKGEASRPFMFQ
jgi:hypothetical protein